MFDEEAFYDANIAPLMAEIIRLCKDRGIPMFATYQLSRTATDECVYCTSSVCADLDHAADRFTEMIRRYGPH